MAFRLISATLLSLLVSQCNLFNKKQRPTVTPWIGPAGAINYDITRLPSGMFDQGNPVGVMRYKDSTEKQMFLCTVFVISKHRLLTNDHCIYNAVDQMYVTPGAIEVYLRNKSDSRQSMIRVTKIIDKEKNKTERFNLHPAEADQDWALLETDVDLSRFAPLDVIIERQPRGFFERDQTLMLPRVNPPTTTAPPFTAVLDPVEIRLLNELFTSQETLRNENQLRQRFCLDNGGARSDCDRVFYTRDDALSQLEGSQSFLFNGKIRQGNSGSPVLFDGKVIGIAYAGLVASLDQVTQEFSVGNVQFFHGLGFRIRK